MDVETPSRRTYAVIALMLFLATLIGYVARANVSVALPFIAEDYGWSSKELGELGGLFLGIFLVGYGISNVFISPLIDYFGPKRGLLVSVSLWSLFTMFTGLFGAFYSIIFLSRLALGLSQGILFPAASKVTQAWFPPSKRGRVNALYLSSGFASNIMVPVLLIPLILATGWQFMFYVVALLGFLLLIPLFLFLKDSPHEEEARERMDAMQLVLRMKESMTEAVKVRGVLLLALCYWATNIVWWGLSLWLPTFLEEARGFLMEDLVWAVAAPYVAGIVGMYFGSLLGDRTGRRGLITSAFAIMASVFALLLSSVHGTAGLMLALSGLWFFLGTIPPNVFTLLQDMVPSRLIGSATGVVNGLANGLGVLGPVIIGIVVAQTGSYDLGLVIMAISLVLAALFILPLRGKGSIRGGDDEQSF